jgi:hypothetical protein
MKVDLALKNPIYEPLTDPASNAVEETDGEVDDVAVKGERSVEWCVASWV